MQSIFNFVSRYSGILSKTLLGLALVTFVLGFFYKEPSEHSNVDNDDEDHSEDFSAPPSSASASPQLSHTVEELQYIAAHSTVPTFYLVSPDIFPSLLPVPFKHMYLYDLIFTSPAKYDKTICEKGIYAILYDGKGKPLFMAESSMKMHFFPSYSHAKKKYDQTGEFCLCVSAPA